MNAKVEVLEYITSHWAERHGRYYPTWKIDEKDYTADRVKAFQGFWQAAQDYVDILHQRIIHKRLPRCPLSV